MNDLQIFKNEQFGEIRIIEINSKTYFGATDSAKSLGYKNTSDAINTHCKKDGVAIREVIDSMGRTQQMNFITEGNLYRLISKSQLPGAEKFESWIFDEVLPTIRKHGAYMTEVRTQQKLFNAMKVEIASSVDEMVQTKINEIEEKCSQYYRPVSKEKANITCYIKKRLGIDKADEEYELVKQRVLIKLGGTKWEDIDVETLRTSLNVIDESIKIIKADRQDNQISLWD